MATSVVTIALCHPRRGWSLGLLGNTTTIFCPRVLLVSVTRLLSLSVAWCDSINRAAHRKDEARTIDGRTEEMR